MKVGGYEISDSDLFQALLPEALIITGPPYRTREAKKYLQEKVKELNPQAGEISVMDEAINLISEEINKEIKKAKRKELQELGNWFLSINPELLPEETTEKEGDYLTSLKASIWRASQNAGNSIESLKEKTLEVSKRLKDKSEKRKAELFSTLHEHFDTFLKIAKAYYQVITEVAKV